MYIVSLLQLETNRYSVIKSGVFTQENPSWECGNMTDWSCSSVTVTMSFTCSATTGSTSMMHCDYLKVMCVVWVPKQWFLKKKKNIRGGSQCSLTASNHGSICFVRKSAGGKRKKKNIILNKMKYVISHNILSFTNAERNQGANAKQSWAQKKILFLYIPSY